MRWIRSLRRLNPGAPLPKILWWRLLQTLVWAALFLLYRHRYWGVRNIPAEGPVLLLCNHQSFLDLTVLGCGIQHRHFHSMARATLFRNRFFTALIRSLNAFPVDQERGDIRAIRMAIDRLKAGHLLLVFPEGSRTPDGAVHRFEPGVMMLVRRAKPTVVPMAVEGVYDIWPIRGGRPRLKGRTGAIYGEPIEAERLLAMKPAEALEMLRRRIDGLRRELRSRLSGERDT